MPFKGKAEECIRQMNPDALNEGLDLNEILDRISDLVAQLRRNYASGSKAIVAA